MSRLLTMCTYAGVAALLVAGAQGNAQESQSGAQALSPQEVRTFLQTMQKTVTDMVGGGDYSQLIAWTQNNVADGAYFTVSVEAYQGDKRKTFSVLTLRKRTWFGAVAWRSTFFPTGPYRTTR